MKKETMVLIVGAGPAGLATSASLNVLEIPNIVLEMEDCCASLWKKHSYERLDLHLAKKFCQLPHMPFPSNTPTFVPKSNFIQYLDNYTSHFKIHPLYNRLVQSASFNSRDGKWIVLAKNKVSAMIENYIANFLVVSTGENSRGFVPNIPGVLVVGCGNSGMEIANDLIKCGAKCSIVVRSPVHILTKEIMQLGMVLQQFIPCTIADTVVVMLAKLKYGDLSSYGLQRPTEGPFHRKAITGRSPVVDVGAIAKIKSGDIQVLPSLQKIDGDYIEFENGETRKFDAIVFATGYRSTVRNWLKEDNSLFNEDGMPKKMKPNHWKGDNGLYCAGFSSSGLSGISSDAKNIASDIVFLVK